MTDSCREIWSSLPASSVQLICDHNKNVDYGLNHQKLGFGDYNEDEGVVKGSRSMGLRYENGHTERKNGDTCCQFSRKHMRFLRMIQTAIHIDFPKLRKFTNDYMRVNLLAGAKTGWHTDTCRGPAPNSLLIQKGSGFKMELHLFPKFERAVVMYQDTLCVPNSVSPAGEVVVNVKTANGLLYKILTWIAIYEFEPFGNLVGTIVICHKKGQLQLLPFCYEVIHSPAKLPMESWENIMRMASQNRIEKPKQLVTILKADDRFN